LVDWPPVASAGGFIKKQFMEKQWHKI